MLNDRGVKNLTRAFLVCAALVTFRINCGKSGTDGNAPQPLPAARSVIPGVPAVFAADGGAALADVAGWRHDLPRSAQVKAKLTLFTVSRRAPSRPAIELHRWHQERRGDHEPNSDR
jgi:hypothetical protein